MSKAAESLPDLPDDSKARHVRRPQDLVSPAEIVKDSDVPTSLLCFLPDVWLWGEMMGWAEEAGGRRRRSDVGVTPTDSYSGPPTPRILMAELDRLHAVLNGAGGGKCGPRERSSA